MTSCKSCAHSAVHWAGIPCAACIAATDGRVVRPNWEPIKMANIPDADGPRPGTKHPAQVLEVATKNDSDKAHRPELLPAEALLEISKVFAFGAKKYSDNNWRGGFKYTRVLGALLRHLFAFMRGEDNDPETGLSHIAHAGCNVLFLLTFILTKTGTDDRCK